MPQLSKPALKIPRLKGPELRMPELRRPEVRMPELRMPRIAMPELSVKRDKSVVGLEIEADSVAAVQTRGGEAGQLAKSAIASLPDGAFHDGEVVDPEAVAAVLRGLFAEHGMSKRVRLGISNQRVVVRTMRLPAIDDPKELDVAVRFQAQEQVPMPLDQAILDYRVVGGVEAEGESAAKIDVILVAARREMIDASLEPLRRAGLQPVGIDLSAFGLIRALGAEASEDSDEDAEPKTAGATLYCNVGDTTNLAVAKGRSCLFTRVAPVGIGAFASNLVQRTGLSLEHARLWLEHVGLEAPVETIEGDAPTVAATREVLEAGLGDLEGELRLSLDFYAAQEGAIPVERVVLGGPGSVIAGLPERLETGFTVPFAVGRPQNLGELGHRAAARLTLSYGLALDA